MTRETFNIIMACKNHGEYADAIESVKDYMAESCNVQREHYSSDQLTDIMKRAMYDYLDTCDKPSIFLRTMDSIFGQDKISTGEHIARAFSITQVMKDDNFINGFGEHLQPK